MIRCYSLNIFNEAGLRIAEIEKHSISDVKSLNCAHKKSALSLSAFHQSTVN